MAVKKQDQFEVDDFSDETPIVAPKHVPTEGSPLERLSARVKEARARTSVKYIVENIEGLTILCDVNIRVEQLQIWQRNAQVRTGSGKREVSQVLLASLMICSQTKAVFLDGVALKDENGSDIRLTDPKFVESIGLEPGVADYLAICVKVFGSEADLLRYSDRLLTDAGFNDDEVLAVEAGKGLKN